MSSYEAVLDLVDRIYGAVQAPATWPAALGAIGRTVGATASSIVYRNLPLHEGGVEISEGVSPEAAAAYQSHYHRLDPWGNSARTAALVRPGAVLDGEELVPRSALVRTEYYNDFARRHGLTRLLAGTVAIHGPVVSVISLLRDDRAPEYGTEERRILGMLMPHLARALEVHRQLAPVSVLHGAAVDALDRLGTGVVLLDAGGRTMFVNRAADRIIRMRDGLAVENGTLAATQPEEREVLRSLVARAARTAAGQSLQAGGALPISRPSLRRPFTTIVVPLGRRHAPQDGPGAAVAVYVTDPEECPAHGIDVLMRLFKLTPAEARLAAAVSAGTDLSDAADALGIARETARTQLRSIFAKTGTTRQADMVRVIVRASPLLPG